jgi:hypothetical protein
MSTDIEIMKLIRNEERFRKFLEEFLENYDEFVKYINFQLLKKEIDKKFEEGEINEKK